LCILPLITGCGKKEEDVSQTPNVISRKVESKENAVQAEVHSEFKAETSSEPVSPPVATIATTQPPLMEDAVSSKKADIYDALIPYMEKDEITPLVKIYNPSGKVDPFVPLFQEKSVAKALVAGSKRERSIPRTPLEMIDLNQLKLTAIIMSSLGNKALVEEASGKGYVIEKGTSLGTKWGKVLEIKKDMVIVDEQEESVTGEITMKRKEMKLQKPFGEN
jgi:type IV pilus assembly protein PilP